jgi:hypothetical protein
MSGQTGDTKTPNPTEAESLESTESLELNKETLHDLDIEDRAAQLVRGGAVKSQFCNQATDVGTS